MKNALSISVAIGLLTACNAGPQAAAPNVPNAARNAPERPLRQPETLLAAAARHPLAFARHRGARSWMEPNAISKELIYVSDVFGNVVYVFNYPKLTPAGLLTGFSEPQGICTDASGDVWIADTFNFRLVEYAHGSKKPKATLSDRGEYPADCSIDPHSGDMAVANILSEASQPGSVSIFKNAAGKPKVYRDSAFARVFFLSYDDKGTIWLDGQNAGSTFAYASLNSGIFTNVTLKGATIDFAGGVSFVNGAITVGDQQGSGGYSIIYQTSGPTITGSTPLLSSSDVVQYFVTGNKIGGTDTQNVDVGFWRYPAGGNERKTFTANWVLPEGIALSP